MVGTSRWATRPTGRCFGELVALSAGEGAAVAADAEVFDEDGPARRPTGTRGTKAHASGQPVEGVPLRNTVGGAT